MPSAARRRHQQSSADHKQTAEHKQASAEHKQASAEDKQTGAAGDAASKPGRRRILSETTIQRLLLRFAILLAAVAVYLYTKQPSGGEQALASVNDVIGKRSQPVDCSTEYAKETAKYSGCSPRRCGRLISDRVVTPQEASKLRAIAARAFRLTGGGAGGASILDLHSGALSQDSRFVSLYELPEAAQLLSNSDLETYAGVRRRVALMVAEHFDLDPAVLHLAQPTFFSRLTDIPAKTVHDQYWHTHVDKETYPSFHYTSLVYLSDYGTEFRGGRFVFSDKDSNRTVEPKIGRVSAFTSGWENPHRVEPVTSGERYALTVAFTCDPERAIGDPKLAVPADPDTESAAEDGRGA